MLSLSYIHLYIQVNLYIFNISEWWYDHYSLDCKQVKLKACLFRISMSFISSVSNCTADWHPNLSIPHWGMLSEQFKPPWWWNEQDCILPKNIINITALHEAVWSPILLSLPLPILLPSSLVLQHCSFSTIYTYPSFSIRKSLLPRSIFLSSSLTTFVVFIHLKDYSFPSIKEKNLLLYSLSSPFLSFLPILVLFSTFSLFHCNSLIFFITMVRIEMASGSHFLCSHYKILF